MPPIKAHFDGKVFIPDEPIDLPLNQPLLLFFQQLPDSANPAGPTAWDILDQLAGTVEAPPDWSAQHDHYLYGTPKRPNPNPNSK